MLMGCLVLIFKHYILCDKGFFFVCDLILYNNLIVPLEKKIFKNWSGPINIVLFKILSCEFGEILILWLFSIIFG